MISVCLATFNGEKYVEDQIKSILIQLNTEDEVLISDDLSTDQTLSIIKNIKDNRLKILPIAKTKLGVIKNFERIILQAQGDYIFLCDQDDIWLNDKIPKCLEALEKNILVVTDCKVVDQSLNVLHDSFFKERQSQSGLIKNFYKNSYLGCCIAFRKELVKNIVPIPESSGMHDIWIGLIAEITGNVKFIPVQLLLFRRHNSNASITTSKNHFGLLVVLALRLKLFFALTKRTLRILLT